MKDGRILDDSMNKSLVVSASMHVFLLILLYVGMPSLFKPLPKPYVPIPIQIVDISDITNTRIKEPEEQVKPPEPAAKPSPPKPQPQVQPQPAPKPPQPKPPEPLKPEQVESLLKPKVQPKPKPVETKTAPPDTLASVLKNVANIKPVETSKAPPDTKAPPAKAATEIKSMAPSVSTRLSISAEDALRRQLMNCWNMPIGARDAEKLIVEVVVDVNPDRTVRNVQIVDTLRMNSDSYFRSAAEAAQRAFYNPRCVPLQLPADGYEQWKRIDFNFDPRDML